MLFVNVDFKVVHVSVMFEDPCEARVLPAKKQMDVTRIASMIEYCAEHVVGGLTPKPYISITSEALRETLKQWNARVRYDCVVVA